MTVRRLTPGQIYYRSHKSTYDKYRKEHPDYFKEHYRANKKMYEGYRNTKRYGGMRSIVLQRDNFRCTECGLTNEKSLAVIGKGLVIHHIDGKGYYSKMKNNELSNLKTVCHSCHARIDPKIVMAGYRRTRQVKSLPNALSI